VIHPQTKEQYFGDHRGTGIVATCFIPAGTLVWIPGPTDELLTYAEISAQSAERKAYLADYAYLTNAGTYIVSNDSARFVNHSCNANSLTIAGPEVSIAIRDIAAGEEMSEDYGLYYANGGFENCACGSEYCRGYIASADIENCGDDWDRSILTALGQLRLVEQPLWPHLDRQLQHSLLHYNADPQCVPSCKTLQVTASELRRAGELLWPTEVVSQT
jgi:hypothetical protein